MARHRRDCSKEDRFRWRASSGQGGVTRPECSRSRWEIQRSSLAHWRMHSSLRLHPPSNSAHRWPSNSARIKHQSRHHAQPPSQAIGVCSAISAPGLIELTPFERDGLGARSLCSVMWPLLAPFASPLLAMVEYLGGCVMPVFDAAKREGMAAYVRVVYIRRTHYYLRRNSNLPLPSLLGPNPTTPPPKILGHLFLVTLPR